MKSTNIRVFGVALGALSLGCGFAHAQEPPQSATPSQAQTAAETAEQFDARWHALKAAGDWQKLLEAGRARRTLRPEEASGWFAEALGAYMRGDIDAAISSWETAGGLQPDTGTWEAAGRIEPRENIGDRLDIARAVRRNYPTLQLQPLQFVVSDAGREQSKWAAKASQLLAAKNYDEIERVARTLQQSNSSDILGIPYLDTFFNELSSAEKAPQTRQVQIAAWQKARPKSALARLAAVDFWVDAAYQARGTGWSSSITPAMGAKMDAALQKATQGLTKLPPSAFDSPLGFRVLQYWGLLSGAGREFLDETFARGTAKFPNYFSLYRNRANQVLPRWYGEAGEWQAMAKKRADQIGGEEGDIFYARIVVDLLRRYVAFPDKEPVDVARTWRGLDALLKRRPDSLALRSAEQVFDVALYSNDRAKRILSAPDGYLLDKSWASFGSKQMQKDYDERRLLVLASGG